MDLRQRQIIEYLMKQTDTALSKELAVLFGVSERTIKRDIKGINDIQPNLIISSKNGYRYNFDITIDVWPSIEKMPENNDERARYIIKQLLLTNVSISIDTFAESLFVSDSTIKSSILVAKKILQRYALQIRVNDKQVAILGSEADKRTLIRDYVYEETTTGFIDLDDIESFFPQINTRAVVHAIQTAFNNQKLFIDEYTLYSLSLHLIIRRNRSHLDFEFTRSNNDDALSHTLSENIFTMLSQALSIPYTDADIVEFATLISNQLRRTNQSLIQNELKHITEITKKIVDEIEITYQTTISDDAFVEKLALHIANLKLRVESNSELKNPMLQSLRNSFPFTYDVAVFTSQRIQHYLNITISDHEIAYIALHIGSYFEVQQAYEHRVKTALVCPDFYQFNVTITKKLQEEFSNSILLIDVVNDLSSLGDASYDLLLSTIPLQVIPHPDKTLDISSFFTDQDKHNVQQFIEHTQLKKRTKKIQSLLHKLTSEDCFVFVDSEINRDDAIHSLCDTLKDNDYIIEGFEKDTLLREELSPTQYGVLAIPHPVKLQATKYHIGIMVAEEGINWDSGIVHVVLLMAIHKSQLREFQELLSTIIFSHEIIQNNVKGLMVNSYQSFIENLLSLLKC